MLKSPTISIVTVTYNAVKYLESTIISVLNQEYHNIEYILIDGNSIDGTLDIIKKYKNSFSKIISESDKGIYDAMNKGLDIASGDWIIFMNAGDKFYNREVLKNVSQFIQNNPFAKVIFGSTIIHYPWGTYCVRPDSISKLSSCMPFCHQSVLVQTNLLKKYRFNDKLRITADHDVLLRIYNDDKDTFLQYNGTIADYDACEGISVKQTMKGYNESKDITNKRDSYFRKSRILMRAYFPSWLLNPLCKIFFFFDKRYIKL